jgi:hypothetical protein
MLILEKFVLETNIQILTFCGLNNFDKKEFIY